ncbi:hypothetical protein CSPAE12_09917, partial [Colletotrichum incanum]
MQIIRLAAPNQLEFLSSRHLKALKNAPKWSQLVADRQSICGKAETLCEIPEVSQLPTSGSDIVRFLPHAGGGEQCSAKRSARAEYNCMATAWRLRRLLLFALNNLSSKSPNKLGNSHMYTGTKIHPPHEARKPRWFFPNSPFERTPVLQDNPGSTLACPAVFFLHKRWKVQERDPSSRFPQRDHRTRFPPDAARRRRRREAFQAHQASPRMS